MVLIISLHVKLPKKLSDVNCLEFHPDSARLIVSFCGMGLAVFDSTTRFHGLDWKAPAVIKQQIDVSRQVCPIAFPLYTWNPHFLSFI